MKPLTPQKTPELLEAKLTSLDQPLVEIKPTSLEVQESEDSLSFKDNLLLTQLTKPTPPPLAQLSPVKLQFTTVVQLTTKSLTRLSKPRQADTQESVKA